jgi:hypothetical protein
MTTIEHTPERVQPHPERPIFLAENGRRARILGIVAKVAAVVTVLWLAALAAGTLGFGHLPGTSLEQPFARLIGGGGDAPKKQAPATDSASVTASGLEQRSAVTRTQAALARRRALARTAAVRARSPLHPAPGQPAAGQSVIAQQPRQQGWTRQGYVAPPGQIRKALTPAPPPGNAYGQAKKTTPPPPPPPPGNGNGNGGTKLK